MQDFSFLCAPVVSWIDLYNKYYHIALSLPCMYKILVFFSLHDYNNSSTIWENSGDGSGNWILKLLFVSRFKVTCGALQLCKGTILSRYFYESLDKSYSGPFIPNHPDQIVSILFSFLE